MGDREHGIKYVTGRQRERKRERVNNAYLLLCYIIPPVFWIVCWVSCTNIQYTQDFLCRTGIMGKTAAIITLQTRSTGRKGQRDKHGNSGWPQYTLKHTERERGRSLHKTHESKCVHNWFLCPHPYPATHPLFLLSAIIKNTFMPVITHSLVQQTDHSLFYHQSTILYFFLLSISEIVHCHCYYSVTTGVYFC